MNMCVCALCTHRALAERELGRVAAAVEEGYKTKVGGGVCGRRMGYSVRSVSADSVDLAIMSVRASSP